jgi:hypothetical protein
MVGPSRPLNAFASQFAYLHTRQCSSAACAGAREEPAIGVLPRLFWCKKMFCDEFSFLPEVKLVGCCCEVRPAGKTCVAN